MEDVTLAHAKEHLEDLIERAARGEDVRISDPKLGTVRLEPVARQPKGEASAAHQSRKPGRLKGKLTVPQRLMEPISEQELRDWYGGAD
jgi:antitoxin (DNA-binding transcriptional repressor) of toxin-antitoxin stability system